MPRTEQVVTIFLASPSDVADERDKLDEVVRDWNKTWAKDLSIRLDVVKWETDAVPGVGVDAQDVINRHISNDYDLFVGLMWCRVGTSTNRAESGTIEEFERALSRYQSNPESLGIFFYFKDAPISPSRVQPEQLSKVVKFKQDLKDRGVLFWEFGDLDQFEKLVGLHITRFVQRIRQKGNALDSQTAASKVVQIESASHEGTHGAEHHITIDGEAGYLDALETFAKRAAEVGEIAQRLIDAQKELTSRLESRTKEITELQRSKSGKSVAVVRKLIDSTAADMLHYSRRVDAEIPLFRTAIDSSMDALASAATVTAEVSVVETESTRRGAEDLRSTVASARETVERLKLSTLQLPRLTKEINVAKRTQAASLEALANEFQNAERLLGEAISLMSSMLATEGRTNVQ